VALALVAVVVGYVLGMVPSALLVGRHLGVDPRAQGSGNPGASNVYRTMGRGPAAVVLGIDLAKGAVAAGAGWAAGGHTVGVAAGAAAVLGHSFPIGRRGGKGAATSAGMLFVLFPVVAFVLALGWALVARVVRRPSVASLVLAVAVPSSAAFVGAPGVEVALLAAVGAVVVLRHVDNIRRLVRGTEAPIEAARP
jgi:glycerol-3-phosphate acyltransferase PlsY